MKYHYQYVSPTTVRIELIPEDHKEMARIQSFEHEHHRYHEVDHLYQTGLNNYIKAAKIVTIKFMNFPTVALCIFSAVEQEVEEMPV